MADSSIDPWRSIGRLNVRGGFCTAVLVGPDVLLTARHCVSDGEMFFLAGYQRGEYAAVSPVRALITQGSGVSGDWALLRLSDPLGNRQGYLAIADFRRGGLGRFRSGAGASDGKFLAQAGYSGDRPHVLTADLACEAFRFLDRERFSHDCDAVSGDSGSPLLVLTRDGYAIAGLHSATTRDGVLGIGISASGARDALSKAIRQR